MQPDPPPPPPPTLESGAFGTPFVAVLFLHFVSCHRNVTWIPGAALSKGWIFVMENFAGISATAPLSL